MNTPWPVVRVVGPTVLARAMEALLSEKGVPISSGVAAVLLLLPPASGDAKSAYDIKGSGKGRIAVRLASDLTNAEERAVCSPPNVWVRALVSVEDPLSCVLDALRAVSQNEAYCSPRLLPGLLEFLHQHEGGVPSEKNEASVALSFREKEVARAAAQGMSNEEIARALHISVATVKFHLSRVFQKLHVSRRSQIRAVLSD